MLACIRSILPVGCAAALVLLVALLVGVPVPPTARRIVDGPTQRDRGAAPLRSEAYGRLPLSFEPNFGQTDAPVQYLARGRGYTFFLTPTEAVLALRAPVERMTDEGPSSAPGAVLRMQPVGADPEARVV